MNDNARYATAPPTALPQWRALTAHADEMKDRSMRQLFAADANRFDGFSIECEDFLLDFSKNLATEDTLEILVDLAEEAGVPHAIEAMFGGERINWTENRAVLHVALRCGADDAYFVDGRDVTCDVRRVLHAVELFSEAVRDGRWRGYTGKRIEHVVNLGIGGSDLGPAMVARALDHYRTGPEVRFVSNVDAADFVQATADLDPATTLFVVASKTFTTSETMTNARSARAWLVDALGAEEAVARHFVAVSTNQRAVTEFGIAEENMFEFWDWVGGRFSLWSAVGVTIAVALGYERFAELLAGARAMDEHFRTRPLRSNIPVVMALIGLWNRNFLGMSSHSILPYADSLARFPAFLQQGDMESNGKVVDRDGNRVSYETGPFIWGEPGTNGQHAFFQLLHQGSQKVSCDFIGYSQPQDPVGDHHLILMANFLAQTEAMMLGRTAEEVKRELEAAGSSPEEIETLLPHKVFDGNRPTNTLLFDRLSPRSLGMLIAAYEHKIFVQGAIWRINSFDQWGVELGKVLAGTLLTEARDLVRGSDTNLDHHDSSTRGLLRRLVERRG